MFMLFSDRDTSINDGIPLSCCLRARFEQPGIILEQYTLESSILMVAVSVGIVHTSGLGLCL